MLSLGFAMMPPFLPSVEQFPDTQDAIEAKGLVTRQRTMEGKRKGDGDRSLDSIGGVAKLPWAEQKRGRIIGVLEHYTNTHTHTPHQFVW